MYPNVSFQVYSGINVLWKCVLALLDNDWAFCGYCMSGDHTKALIGQLIIFNQILGELREDIREQVGCVSVCGFVQVYACSMYVCLHTVCDWAFSLMSSPSPGEGDVPD